MLTAEQDRALEHRMAEEDRTLVWFERTLLSPAEAGPLLDDAGSSSISQPTRAVDLLRRPKVSASAVLGAAREGAALGASLDAVATVEVELKYAGYVARERERAGRLREQAEFVLPDDLPYDAFVTVSYEAREKLGRIRPETLAQAGRVPGVSPADLQNLVLEVRRLRSPGKATVE
jgi:tRNA uridine 5-carboxymethylaminomethyl modification enzyme